MTAADSAPGPVSAQRTLMASLRAHAAAAPDRTACVFLDERGREAGSLTYRELIERVRATAAALLRRTAPGERALLMCATGPEFVIGFLGCLSAGVLAVPVPQPDRFANGPRHLGRLAGIAADAEPALLLTTAAFLASADTDSANGSSAIDGSAAAANPAADGPAAAGARPERFTSLGGLNVETLAVSDLWAEPATRAPAPAALPLTSTSGPALSAAAFLQYTSGSTGDPKGAVITQGALSANLWAVTEALELGGLGPDLRVVSWLPLYHDMGLMQLTVALGNGGTAVLMPQTAFLLRPAAWLEALGRYRAHLCSAPDFAYELCVERVPQEQRAELDLSALAHAICGAEPVRPATVERFTAAFAPAGLRPGVFEPAYGLAEATLYVSGRREPGDPIRLDLDAAALAEHGRVEPVAAPHGPAEHRPANLGPADHGPADHDPARRSMAGCGRVAANLDVRIVDPDTLRECPPDRIGEIWVAGPSVARGYWGREAATAERFGGTLAAEPSAGPFLRTGDLGFLHDGQLFVAGRLDDLVVVDGRNHYPSDLEPTVTASHPALAAGQAVVFGFERDGRTLVAALAETARGVRIAPRGAEPQTASGAGAPAAASSAAASAAGDADTAARPDPGAAPLPLARGAVERAVRRAVAEEHQLQVAAVVLVKPGALPRTTSGKFQRKAGRRLFLDGGLNTW